MRVSIPIRTGVLGQALRLDDSVRGGRGEKPKATGGVWFGSTRGHLVQQANPISLTVRQRVAAVAAQLGVVHQFVPT